MTRFAPPLVHPCPGCDSFFLLQRFYSINTYGMARDWSDGAPFTLSRQEPLVRCNACAALFWLDDSEPVGIMPSRPQPIGRLARAWIHWCGDRKQRFQEEAEWARAQESWGSAQSIGSVSLTDVMYVLARSKGVSRDRGLWLRKRIWWTLNDRYRRESDDPSPADVCPWPATAERSNMEAILDMLRDGEVEPGGMVEEGELLRLLGRFDQAIAVLKAVPSDGRSEIRALKLEKLALNGDAQVRLLSQHVW